MNPLDVKIDEDWRKALWQEFEKPYFDQIVGTLKQEKQQKQIVYPPGELIFNAFNTTKPKDVKVVIIGQDPFHNPMEAMGLSFSVPKGIKVPPSLKNVYKELNNDIGFEVPNHGDLTFWASQGVFLLNAILTVKKNEPGSHKNIGWQIFTDQVIQYLSTHQRNIVFMLWGNFAKNKKDLIDSQNHFILESAHPSPLAGNAFQGCKHFSKANEYLIKNGKTAIQWQINN